LCSDKCPEQNVTFITTKYSELFDLD